MDSEVLVENLFEDGYNFLIELAREGVDITVAAWLKRSENGPWSLFIGSTSLEAGSPSNPFQAVHNSLLKLPIISLDMSQIRLMPSSHPLIRDLAAIRDRYPRGRLPARYGGKNLGGIEVTESYIYPKITTGLTRDEVVQTVTGLMNRSENTRSSSVTLRDGREIKGKPFGLETDLGSPPVLRVKILDDGDGSTQTVSVDEVCNIQ